MGNLRGTLCYIFKENVGFVRNDGYLFVYAKKKGLPLCNSRHYVCFSCDLFIMIVMHIMGLCWCL